MKKLRILKNDRPIREKIREKFFQAGQKLEFLSGKNSRENEKKIFCS